MCMPNLSDQPRAIVLGSLEATSCTPTIQRLPSSPAAPSPSLCTTCRPHRYYRAIKLTGSKPSHSSPSCSEHGVTHSYLGD